MTQNNFEAHIEAAYVQDIGTRNTQQDVVFAFNPDGNPAKVMVGVFDGNGEFGGEIASESAEVAKNAFIYAQDSDPHTAIDIVTGDLKAFDDELKKRKCARFSGTTALVACIDHNLMVIGAAGDSGAMRVNQDGTHSRFLVNLHDANNDEERTRVLLDQRYKTGFNGARFLQPTEGEDRIYSTNLARSIGASLLPFQIAEFGITSEELTRPSWLIFGSDGAIRPSKGRHLLVEEAVAKNKEVSAGKMAEEILARITNAQHRLVRGNHKFPADNASVVAVKFSPENH